MSTRYQTATLGVVIWLGWRWIGVGHLEILSLPFTSIDTKMVLEIPRLVLMAARLSLVCPETPHERVRVALFDQPLLDLDSHASP